MRRSDWPRHLRAVERTEGHLSRGEAAHLYSLAAAAESCIVEVGSYRGRSTVALALGSLSGHRAPVYAIDPHEEFTGVLGGHFGATDRQAFFTNLLNAGVVEQVRLVNLPSVQAAQGWTKTVDLLWIDGDHRYEAVRQDVDAWLPHLTPLATVALHDAHESALGPCRVVEELVAGGGFQREVEVDGLSVLQRLG